jgi:hypothetical protein
LSLLLRSTRLFRRTFSAITIGLSLSACDSQPIATAQILEAYSDCTMIRAEIEGNNQKAKQLADEQGPEESS